MLSFIFIFRRSIISGSIRWCHKVANYSSIRRHKEDSEQHKKEYKNTKKYNKKTSKNTKIYLRKSYTKLPPIFFHTGTYRRRCMTKCMDMQRLVKHHYLDVHPLVTVASISWVVFMLMVRIFDVL